MIWMHYVVVVLQCNFTVQDSTVVQKFNTLDPSNDDDDYCQKFHSIAMANKLGFNLILQEFVECMYLKSLDTSSSDAKPSIVDIVTWVDQAYKMLKNQNVSSSQHVFFCHDTNCPFFPTHRMK